MYSDVGLFFPLFLSQVEDAVSRAADGMSVVQELDFSSLRSQLGPLAAVSIYFLPIIHLS